MAAKTNESPSDIDKTTFWWVGLCGICHPGGGPGEFDRDGELLWDERTGAFGYEKLGKTAAEVLLDGDYSEISNKTGDLRAAPWDKTGVAEADCLMCHRTDRTVNEGKNMNWIWRAATLRAKDKLVDADGGPVQAYAAAATAGQGWFSAFGMKQVPPGKPPLAETLQIDYQKGLDNESLYQDDEGKLYMSGFQIIDRPKDYACWGCHLKPEMKKRGRAWFNKDIDVHYAAFNNLNDEDTSNDIPPGESAACTVCHPAGMDHNLAKGNATLGSVHNDLDYKDFRTCRSCHDPDNLYPGAKAPPDTIQHSERHLEIMSCESCHVPYKTGAADLVVDNSVTGSTIGYPTSAFLSADPLNPAGSDKSRWAPSFVRKQDEDGRYRLYPVKLLLSAWWGDWDVDAGVVRPIPLWRVRAITKGAALAGVTDDNGDGKPEVNRLAEIKLYIDALKADDKYGNPVATNPVLIRGGSIWHEDTEAEEGVSHFEYHGTGIKTESSHPFSVNHNVLDSKEALGAKSCSECHSPGGGSVPTPVFDRLVLVDPWGPDGQPVYKTVAELTGVDPGLAFER